MINLAAQPIELPSFGQVACIQRVVAGSFGLSVEQLMSDRRDYAWPRQVAMYLSRELTPKSYPHIGRLFHRDHTTIIHACRRVELRMAAETILRDDVEALIEALTPRPVEKGENSTITMRNSQEDGIEHSMNNQVESMAA